MSQYEAAPSEIEKASGGLVKPGDLRNWVHQGFFNTRLPTGRPGKPRMLPREAIYEAALLAHFAAGGVDLKRAKLWNMQILKILKKEGHASRFGNLKNSSSPLNIIFFNPHEDKLVFVSSPAHQSVKSVIEMFAGMTAIDKTYAVSNTLIEAINVAGLIDSLDRALDTKRFSPPKA